MSPSEADGTDTTPHMSDAAQAALHDAQGVLQGLNLLGSTSDDNAAEGFMSAFSGPPQSVALIEAGATAMSKWWAAGLGTAVIGVWGAVRVFWGSQTDDSQRVLLWCAAIATAAAVLAIAAILAWDIRGRALAAAATIEARARVAEVIMQGIPHGTAAMTTGTPSAHLLALRTPLRFRLITRRASDEKGWHAVVVSTDGESAARYLLIKGSKQVWAGADELVYTPK
jgi:hypothetical protein